MFAPHAGFHPYRHQGTRAIIVQIEVTEEVLQSACRGGELIFAGNTRGNSLRLTEWAAIAAQIILLGSDTS